MYNSSSRNFRDFYVLQIAKVSFSYSSGVTQGFDPRAGTSGPTRFRFPVEGRGRSPTGILVSPSGRSTPLSNTTTRSGTGIGFRHRRDEGQVGHGIPPEEGSQDLEPTDTSSGHLKNQDQGFYVVFGNFSDKDPHLGSVVVVNFERSPKIMCRIHSL